MPEYHQIETYINLPLKSDLDKIRLQLFSFIDSLSWFEPSDAKNWLSRFSWEPSEDGFVHSTKELLAIKHEQFDIRFVLLGWTPKILPLLNSNCIELEILFKTEQIDDLSRMPQIRYTKQAQTAVWQIMKTASKHFQDYGVFFTDEAQDTNSFEGILEANTEKLWQFELAIIDSNYRSLYQPLNSSFFEKKFPEELWLARKFVWDNPPWILQKPI